MSLRDLLEGLTILLLVCVIAFGLIFGLMYLGGSYECSGYARVTGRPHPRGVCT